METPAPLKIACFFSNFNLEQRNQKHRVLKGIQGGMLSWQDKLTLINEAN